MVLYARKVEKLFFGFRVGITLWSRSNIATLYEHYGPLRTLNVNFFSILYLFCFSFYLFYFCFAVFCILSNKPLWSSTHTILNNVGHA